MSTAKTTTTASTDAEADGGKPTIVLHPVAAYDSPLAKGVSFGRIAVLLSLLGWQMDNLVADPVSTLSRALPAVAAVQVGYAALSIPPAGSSSSSGSGSGSKGGKKSRPGEKAKKNDGAAGNPISSAIIALLLSTLTIPALYALFVLFGAPFLEHTSHTMLAAAHFALLAVFPLVYARGLDRRAMVAAAGAAAPLDETYGGLVGAAAGAWLGAVPIPLDWDRDWQRWPVTIVVGVYLGAAAGSLLAGTVLFGKRMAGHAVKAD